MHEAHVRPGLQYFVETSQRLSSSTGLCEAHNYRNQQEIHLEKVRVIYRLLVGSQGGASEMKKFLPLCALVMVESMLGNYFEIDDVYQYTSFRSHSQWSETELLVWQT
jgi:hypothetical protein